MLVITGSIGFDYILNFPGKFSDRIMPDQIHKISLSFLVNRMDKQWGGTAGNICYSLGLFGDNPILFATAGNDFAEYKKFLEKHGVETSYIKEYKKIATGTYFVITDTEDNQIGAFYTGAMQHAKSLSLKKVKVLSHHDLVLIAPNDPMAMKRYVLECQQMKVPYMYDPAFQIGNFSAKELQKAVSGCEILIGNDYEIELIVKKLKLTKKQLLEMVPVVVTTLGSKGAEIVVSSKYQVASKDSSHSGKRSASRISERSWTSQDDVIKIKSAKAKNSSDPTGAGDAFRAGFLAGYIRGFNLQVCGQMGATAAVYTVEKYGTTTHTFSRHDFVKRYAKNFGKLPTL